MNKVIITLTTVPERLDSNPTGLKKCINSLLSQDYDDFEIHFNILNVCIVYFNNTLICCFYK